MTHSDSKHYEFYLTQANVNEAISPPPGESWMMLHVVHAELGGSTGPMASLKKPSVLIVWSRQKKH